MSSTNKDMEFESKIVSYLKKHPDFFEVHQDLLVTMSLPHEAGSAVSLIERQVQVLREKNTQQTNKLHGLISTAQNNENLNNNVNSLILELLDAKTLDEVLVVIKQRMRTDFEADAIAVKLLASGNGSLKDHHDLTAWQQPALVIGEKVMSARQPMCGAFNGAQMQALFDDADILSAGIIPLVKDENSKKCYGIVAIGSYDAERFRADMGTLFLALLGQVLTRILKRHLEA